MRNSIKWLINCLDTYLKVHCGIRACSELVAKCIRPDPNRVLFGAMNGKWYGDNSRHLFEWVQANRPDWEPVWLSRSPAVLRELQNRGLPVADMRRPRGMFLLFKAKRGVFTNSLKDLTLFPFLVPNRLRLIALRHGRSVKKIRFARQGHPISPKEVRERLRENQLIEYAASTSDFVSDMQEACLQIGRERHRVTGYPRNDELIRKASADGKPLLRRRFLEHSFEEVILYAPSWRHGREPTRFFPFADFDPKALEESLQAKKTLLLLRPHLRDLESFPAQASFLQELAQTHSRIAMATHQTFPDVNTLLPEVDRLLTDYSALYHDFLLLDRPIGFIPYDYADFEEQNGFLYDYFGNLPGTRIDCAASFINWIHAAQSDSEKERRQLLRTKIHAHTKADSCRRIAELVDLMEAS